MKEALRYGPCSLLARPCWLFPKRSVNYTRLVVRRPPAWGSAAFGEGLTGWGEGRPSALRPCHVIQVLPLWDHPRGRGVQDGEVAGVPTPRPVEAGPRLSLQESPGIPFITTFTP